MGTIRKSGQASITNGKLGTTTNYSLGSTGTTHYSLNKGGGLVTTQWLIAGVPWSQTLRSGDTIQHSWQLGRTGTTSYNMGRNGTKTLKYTLDPGGDIVESNGKLSGKSGTASYTLGTGSRSDVKATLSKGSTQSYTVGTGGSSTITMVIDGIPQTVTLGEGDSSTTTIEEGAEAVLECSSTYDADHPPVESMTYDVGEDGSTDNTWGSDIWDVWLFQPYNVGTKTDYNPICVVMPRGEYTPGCPGRLPSFIQDNGDYAPDTNCRYILVGSAYHSAEGWKITQNCIGTLTFPTEATKKDVTTDNPSVAPDEIVNHYQAEVFGAPGNWQLRVGRGGNVWRPVLGACDKQLRTEVITPAASVGLNPGSITTSPWASDDGYVNIYEESDYYVYAYKVETLEDTYFYIYVTTDSTLDSACPPTLPEEIPTPVVTHTVQVLRVAEVYWETPNWYVNQRVIGSITWPSSGGSVAADPEQFKVEVSGNNVKVAKGRIVAMHSSDFPLMYTLDQKMLEFNVEGFAVYPDGSRVEGGNPNSVWCSQNGYVTITNAEDKNDWGVYIIRNQLGPYGDLGTYPLLAVMADDSDAYDKSKAFPPGTGSSGQYHWGAYQEIINVTISGPDGGSGKLIGSVMPYALQNFCCERLKIASITWDADTSKWVVTQHLIGSLTIPSNIVGGVVTEVTTLPPYPTSSLPGFKTECQAWFDAWTGYTKLLTPSSGYTTSIIES
jgi:hypothetical protein